MTFNLQERSRAAGWHFLASMGVAAAVAALVFGIWYPGPYRDMAGGRDLLVLIMLVDVAMGPILTFAVFNTEKGRGHLKRDIATIALLQLAALVYGLHSVYLARPVALAFEHDRFRVISAAEVLEAELPHALPEFQQLPLDGPRTLAVRRAARGTEHNDSLLSSVVDGVDTSQRPKFWVPYGAVERAAATKAGRSVSQLVDKYPDAAQPLRTLLDDSRLTVASATFLPVRARKDAVVVLGPDGTVAGFLLFDGYF